MRFDQPMFIIEEILKYLKPKYDVLALGTDTRQKIAFSKSGKVFELSPLQDFSCSEDFYQEAACYLSQKVKTGFQLISFDPHPLFASCAFSAIIKNTYYPHAKLVPVWHHVAHVASFGHEAGINKSFIGIAFDGTGYGADGRVWGGEFFVYDTSCFKRAGHFEYQLLPGSEASIREPWRFAFSVLYRYFGKNIFEKKLKCFQGLRREDLKLLAQMLDKGFNSPQTSSVGRLFDAASAILHLKTKITKEAEAAIALEEEASRFMGKVKPYGFDIYVQEDVFQISPRKMFIGMLDDLDEDKSASAIAFRFHKTLAEMICCTARLLSKKYGVNDVYCSGGVFMNDILSQEVRRLFEGEDLNLFFAPRPLNTDLGIAHGQIAACMMEALCV